MDMVGIEMVGVERFELPTSCSQSRRATGLRYTPKDLKQQTFKPTRRSVYGRGGEIRTPDILLPKQARYRTALHPERNKGR